MSVQLALKCKTTGEIAKLAQLDDQMCHHFGVEPDGINFYANWMDTIGFSLALQKTWEETAGIWDFDPRKCQVICYLMSRYDNVSY